MEIMKKKKNEFTVPTLEGYVLYSFVGIVRSFYNLEHRERSFVLIVTCAYDVYCTCILMQKSSHTIIFVSFVYMFECTRVLKKYSKFYYASIPFSIRKLFMKIIMLLLRCGTAYSHRMFLIRIYVYNAAEIFFCCLYLYPNFLIFFFFTFLNI